MRHVKNKKGKDKVAATIVLCFCLIALTSIFTIQASIDKIKESAGDLAVDQQMATEENESTSPALEKAHKEPTSTTKDGAADLPVSKEIPTVDSMENSEAPATYLPPVNLSTAVILKEYSMDMVIYNKTLDQYMTHPGMDFKAPSGSGVNSIAEGTVTDVYEDDAYGTTIEITHAKGIVSKYSCLETSSLVEKGDSVSQGQHISTIGKTALYESMEPCHLHFEIYKNGELCNPADYIPTP